LDVLGATPWRINQFVLNTALRAWENGGGMLELPSRVDLVIPTPPASFVDDPKERRKFQVLIVCWLFVVLYSFLFNRFVFAKQSHQRRVIQQQRDLHGLRCALNYQLDVAVEFKDRVFYFPHNLDFRGRSYPIPPHLNQMGSDLCRGLLMFAEAKPLGSGGMRWLKIHLANLYGNDKITHDERLSFIDSQMDDVLASAADPLGSGTWWQKADSPWQALGVCQVNEKRKEKKYQMSIFTNKTKKKAIRDAISSGDPASFLCNVPVHQDGSCNGLQHYAALGGDVRGAEQVNLLPRATPQDVYELFVVSYCFGGVLMLLETVMGELPSSLLLVLQKTLRKVRKKNKRANTTKD
jgi:DNA-directed RNA polymerase